MNESVQDIPIKESNVIWGYLNGHVEKTDGHKRLKGGSDRGQTNVMQKATFKFTVPFDLTITNLNFLVTILSGLWPQLTG